MLFPESQERYLHLAEKWLNGTITEKEKEEFSAWYNKMESDEIIINTQFAVNDDELRNRILHQINKRNRNNTIVLFIKTNRYRIVVAAILLLIGGSFLFNYFNDYTNKISHTEISAVVSEDSTLNNDLMPGGDKAILTLSDGTEVMLDDVDKGTIIIQGKSKIIRSEDGRVLYHPDEALSGDVVYNTITTPRGGQYRVELPDRTRVWMNAASSMRFPTSFTGPERIVEVSGELYFDVAKNPDMPFSIQVKGSRVQALGTEFNIMAYNNEGSLKTTLVNGLVKINHGTGSAILKPGQQAVCIESGKINIHKSADVELATAWKNGYTSFRDADMESIMRQVERWYDVDVQFDKNVSKRYFTGDVSRKAKLSDFLQVLDKSGIRFKVEGRIIKVKN